jgi:hypothetical protein
MPNLIRHLSHQIIFFTSLAILVAAFLFICTCSFHIVTITNNTVTSTIQFLTSVLNIAVTSKQNVTVTIQSLAFIIMIVTTGKEPFTFFIQVVTSTMNTV